MCEPAPFAWLRSFTLSPLGKLYNIVKSNDISESTDCEYISFVDRVLDAAIHNDEIESGILCRWQRMTKANFLCFMLGIHWTYSLHKVHLLIHSKFFNNYATGESPGTHKNTHTREVTCHACSLTLYTVQKTHFIPIFFSLGGLHRIKEKVKRQYIQIPDINIKNGHIC